MEIWSHPYTPFLYGVPGNVEERSNISARFLLARFSICYGLCRPRVKWDTQISLSWSLLGSKVWVWMFFFWICWNLPNEKFKWCDFLSGKNNFPTLHSQKKSIRTFFLQDDLTYHTVTHRIHVWYLFLHVVDFYGTLADKYPSLMDPMASNDFWHTEFFQVLTMWVWPLIVGKSVALEMIWDTFGHRCGSWGKKHRQWIWTMICFFEAIRTARLMWFIGNISILVYYHIPISISSKFTRICRLLLEWICPMLYYGLTDLPPFKTSWRVVNFNGSEFQVISAVQRARGVLRRSLRGTTSERCLGGDAKSGGFVEDLGYLLIGSSIHFSTKHFSCVLIVGPFCVFYFQVLKHA